MKTIEKRHPAFTDDDPMPFGKYKGERLEEVPSEYLHWLWHETDVHQRNPPLANYIWNSQEDIKYDLGNKFIKF
jgi:hypothetical protein